MTHFAHASEKARRLPIFAAPMMKGSFGAPIELSAGSIKRKPDHAGRRNWAKRRAFKV